MQKRMDDLVVEMRFDLHLFRGMRQQVGDMNVLASCREEVGGERAIKRKLGPQTVKRMISRATSSLF